METETKPWFSVKYLPDAKTEPSFCKRKPSQSLIVSVFLFVLPVFGYISLFVSVSLILANSKLCSGGLLSMCGL